jgi:hypothetical protein
MRAIVARNALELREWKIVLHELKQAWHEVKKFGEELIEEDNDSSRR